MSKRFNGAVLVLGSSLALVGFACGGSDGGSIPNTDAGASADGAGQQPGVDGGLPPDMDGAVQPGTDAGPQPGTDGAVQPGTDGSVPQGDGGVADGTAPPVGDGGVQPDAQPPFTGIACGTSVCHVGSEVCCNRATAPGRNGIAGREEVCVAPSACADGGQPIGCNKPADCTGGTVCCATYVPRSGSVTEVQCAATCERGAADAGVRHYTVCDLNMYPACTTAGEQCSQSLSVQPIIGLNVCQPSLRP